MDSEIEAVPVHRAGSETRAHAYVGLQCPKSAMRSHLALCGSANNSDRRCVDLHPRAPRLGSPVPSFSRYVRPPAAWSVIERCSVVLLGRKQRTRATEAAETEK